MKRLRMATASLFVAVLCQPAVAQDFYQGSFDPRAMTDKPVGEPNEVAVLATPHLSGLPDTFVPAMVEPLVDRLVEYRPTVVAIENMSGVTCAYVNRHPDRFEGVYERFCYNTETAAQAIGMDVAEANAEVERTLEAWPSEPTYDDRRRLAAIFLAAGESMSALVQWLRLPDAQRTAGGMLTAELAAELDRLMRSKNESALIAAPVAAKVGLERVWSVDHQAVYLGPLDDRTAYADALTDAWNNPSSKARRAQTERLNKGLEHPNGLLEYYRALNAPEYAEVAYRGDWGAALVENSDNAYGRRYVAYWETRNLMMVANIREALGRHPGSRMLAVVGASHKGYYEAYLSMMRDVELYDINRLLE